MPRRAKYALYVFDLPVDVLQQICTTLDNDKGWMALAAECGYNMDKVASFNLEYYRQYGSPTERLISDWGVRNPTILDLYEKLHTIGRIREMKLLEPILQASEEYERQERARKEAEEQEAKERQAKEREAKERKAKEREEEAQAKKAKEEASKGREAKAEQTIQSGQKKANNLDMKTGKSRSLLEEPVAIAVASNGKSGKQTKSPIQGKYEALNQLDRDKSHYEELNLDDNSQDEKAKVSQKKELGVELQVTEPIHRKYPEASSCKLNQSQAENLADVNRSPLPLQSSSDKKCEIQMSDAKSLPYSSAGELAKDLVVAARFTYKDLSCATNGFADGSKIGEGGFGDVYLAVLKNSKCAVKRLRQVDTEMWKASKEQIDHHVSEIKSLMLYRHENIVQLYGFAIDGNEICLVYQYMENGSLEDRLQCRDDTRPLTWMQRINILCGTARGIQYLHTMDPSHPLIHADIKSANVLLDKHFEAKISDFGLAEYANAGQKTGMFTHVSKKDMKQKSYGAMAYLPSEFFSNGPSIKSDTYGFGVIILETCTGEKAYDEKRESDVYLGPYVCTLMEEQPEEEWRNHLDQRAGSPPNHIHHLLKLAQKCISERKKDRPVMTVALERLEWIVSKWKEEEVSCESKVAVGRPDEWNPTVGSLGVNVSHSPIQSHLGHQASNQAARNSLPRMTSLPCKATPPCLSAKYFAKSHSLDEEPESMKLQRMYDMNQYQRQLEKLRPVLTGEQGLVEEGPVEEGLYPSNPEKLAEMQRFDDPDSLDSNSSEKTLTDDSSKRSYCSMEDPTSRSAEDVTLADGSDPAKVKAMQEFYESHRTVEVQQKVETLSLQNSKARQHPSASYPPQNSIPEGKILTNNMSKDKPTVTDAGSLPCQSEASSGLPPPSEQDCIMKNFFEKYNEELDSLNCSGYGGTVFCGNTIIDGQQMAILMDPKSNQYYAVDPSTLDPAVYHHQQLTYYMQSQGCMPAEGQDASHC